MKIAVGGLMKAIFATVAVLLGFTFSHASQLEPVFNRPGFSGGTAQAIDQQILKLISGTAASSQIHISMYNFDNLVLAQELLRAQARGVAVQLVLDGKSKKNAAIPGHPVQVLNDGLRCGDKPCITFCKSLVGSSCRGLVINHNKFYLISQLQDGRRDVVLQTSMNANGSQTHMYNDSLTVYDDERLYVGYLDYWRSLQKDKFHFSKPDPFEGQEKIRAYLFPRLIGKDPVLNLLKKVSCKLPGSTIRVAQSRFDNSRSKVAKQLALLRSQGCDVKVIARSEQSVNSPGSKVRSYLGPDLFVLAYQGDDDTDQAVSQNSIHSKILLINASFDGSQEKLPVVLMGSHNLNLTSLKTNDEVLLRIIDQQVFSDYSDYWDLILGDAKAAGVILP